MGFNRLQVRKLSPLSALRPLQHLEHHGTTNQLEGCHPAYSCWEPSEDGGQAQDELSQGGGDGEDGGGGGGGPQGGGELHQHLGVLLL